VVELIQSESLDIEPFTGRRLAETDNLAWDGVWAVPPGVRAICARAHADRKATSKGQDRAYSPSTDDGIHYAATV
jgi:hypothetical protein